MSFFSLSHFLRKRNKKTTKAHVVRQWAQENLVLKAFRSIKVCTKTLSPHLTGSHNPRHQNLRGKLQSYTISVELLRAIVKVPCLTMFHPSQCSTPLQFSCSRSLHCFVGINACPMQANETRNCSSTARTEETRLVARLYQFFRQARIVLNWDNTAKQGF